MKTYIFIQARMGSKRLPGKVLKPILGRPVLGHIVDRLKPLGLPIVVLAPHSPEDTAIGNFWFKGLPDCGYSRYTGDPLDVLGRFYSAGVFNLILNPDRIIRIMGDCPLIDYRLIPQLLEGSEDYSALSCDAGGSFHGLKCYPNGLDCEVISWKALKSAHLKATDPYDREHVTPYIWKESPQNIFEPEKDHSGERWTLDTEKDLEFITRVYEELYPANPLFSWTDVLELLERKPELREINQEVKC